MHSRSQRRAGPAARETPAPHGAGGAAVLRALPWVLTVLAAALRFYRLDTEPLWFDEAYTALAAVKPVAGIVALLRDEGNAPLYYLWLHAWVAVFGDGAFALRALSALIGTVTVPVVYWVTNRLFSLRAGLIAAVLAMVSPLQIHYSQEVRMYCLLPPLSLGVLYGLYRLLVVPGRAAFAVFVLSASAGLYVHYYFLFLLPLAACAVLAPERGRALLGAAAALACVVAAFGPWWPTLARQAGSGVQDWVAEWWKTHSFWYAVPWSLEVLGPGADYPSMANFKFGSSAVAQALSLVLAALVVGCAGWSIVRNGAGSGAGKRQTGERRTGARPGAPTGGGADLAWVLTLGAVLVPLGSAFALSVVRSPIYVVGRHDMIAWGPYYVLAGAVLSRWRPPLAAVGVMVWVVVSVTTLVPYYKTLRPKRNYADMGDVIARKLVEDARPEDLTVFTAATRTMTQYYLRAHRDRFRLVSYPLENDTHLGWADPRIRSDPAFAAEAASAFGEWLRGAGPRPATVWVVGPQSRGVGPLFAELARLGYGEDRARSSPLILCLRHGQP